MAVIPPLIDLTGQQINSWYVIKRAPNGNHGQTMWLCQCVCGKIKPVNSQHLRTGRSTNCGCQSKRFTAEYNRKTKTKHGWASHTDRTRLYIIYEGMKRRCYGSYSRSYKDYGGRGIKICDQWLGEHGFENFRDWALANGYRDDLTIDRIDVNGDYSPENCRWATPKQQANNKRNNHRITIDGVTKTATEWGNEIGLTAYEVHTRLQYMGEIEAVTIPKGDPRADRKYRKVHGL